MNPKSQVGDAACPRVTLFCHLPPNLHLPPSHLQPASHLPSCPRTAGGTCQSARKAPDAHLDGDQYDKCQLQAGGKMFGEAGRLAQPWVGGPGLSVRLGGSGSAGGFRLLGEDGFQRPRAGGGPRGHRMLLSEVVDIDDPGHPFKSEGRHLWLRGVVPLPGTWSA
eukprot:7382703-Prymnesium_polylepis.1